MGHLGTTKLGICLLGILFLLVLPAVTTAAPSVRLTTGEWAPYSSRNLPHLGVSSRIITEAFALTGVTVEFFFFDSWKRSFVLAEKGVYDGSVLWIPTPERKKTFYFTDPIAFHTYVLFHLKTFPFQWQTISDLAKYRICVTDSYSFGKAFDTAMENGELSVFRVYTDKANIQNLLQNRVDVFPMDMKVGYHLIRSRFQPDASERITHHPRPLEHVATSVIISKKIDPERAARLVRDFNRGLRQLKQSGRYDQLMTGQLK